MTSHVSLLLQSAEEGALYAAEGGPDDPGHGQGEEQPGGHQDRGEGEVVQDIEQPGGGHQDRGQGEVVQDRGQGEVVNDREQGEVVQDRGQGQQVQERTR